MRPERRLLVLVLLASTTATEAEAVASQAAKGFEKGSTVYLTNVKRWIDSKGSVVLTVRRVRQIPKDLARERLSSAKFDYGNDRILIRPKPPPPPTTTTTPTPPPPPRPPPISVLPLAYEVPGQNEIPGQNHIPGSNEIRGNEIPGLLKFEETRNRGVGPTGSGRRRRRYPKRRKVPAPHRYFPVGNVPGRPTPDTTPSTTTPVPVTVHSAAFSLVPTPRTTTRRPRAPRRISFPATAASVQRPPVINAVLRTRKPRRQPRPPPALRFEPEFKPRPPRSQTPIPLLPLTARISGEERRVRERKPDLALDLGSSYRFENRRGANVYGCYGFAMPKKKRSRRGFVGPLLKPKMMDTVFMADEGGYRVIDRASARRYNGENLADFPSQCLT